jgi:hypothetical protein
MGRNLAGDSSLGFAFGCWAGCLVVGAHDDGHNHVEEAEEDDEEKAAAVADQWVDKRGMPKVSETTAPQGVSGANYPLLNPPTHHSWPLLFPCKRFGCECFDSDPQASTACAITRIRFNASQHAPNAPDEEDLCEDPVDAAHLGVVIMYGQPTFLICL